MHFGLVRLVAHVKLATEPRKYSLRRPDKMHVMFSYLYNEPLAIYRLYRQAEQSSIVSTDNGSCLPVCIDCIDTYYENMCSAVHQHASGCQA